MRIFVAGATGVIGRRVVPLMVAAGHRVTAIARHPEAHAALERAGAIPVRVDLFAPGAVSAAAAGHEVVVNMATRIPPSSRAFLPGAWRENDRLRRVASGHLVEAAIAGGAARFIQESFAPIYRDCGDAWIDEATPVRPSRHDRAVLEAEAAAGRFSANGGTGIVLRFGFFYGPDSGYTLDLVRFVRKGWAPSFGAPERFVSSVSHDDAASAVVAALHAHAGTYNVVDDEPLRRREYFDSLAALLGVGPPRFPPRWLAPLTGSLGETLGRSQRMSNRKLRAACGWAPRYPSVRQGWRHVLEASRPSGA